MTLTLNIKERLRLWFHTAGARSSSESHRIAGMRMLPCEGGFAVRQLGDVQMLLTKPDCRRAVLTR